MADEPVASRTVNVLEYQQDWPERAAVLTSLLREALRSPVRRIEHIGSTAVPGMAAKDVLDVQISVVDLDTAATAFDQLLRTLGFERLPYEHDHVPAGSTDDPQRWIKRFWVRRGHPQGEANLHVRVVGSPNERLALLFRDWFRAHPEAVPAYGSFKRSLARNVAEVDIYSDVKDPVVDLVTVVAEQWAMEVGWHL